MYISDALKTPSPKGKGKAIPTPWTHSPLTIRQSPLSTRANLQKPPLEPTTESTDSEEVDMDISKTQSQVANRGIYQTIDGRVTMIGGVEVYTQDAKGETFDKDEY